jgi:hypothetical protein
LRSAGHVVEAADAGEGGRVLDQAGGAGGDVDPAAVPGRSPLL